MTIFQSQPPENLVPVHSANARSKDWIVLLEANTIVGPTQNRLRVARTTQERNVIKKYVSMQKRLFLVIDGYDPRIHALYFCPQLYRYDGDDKLVPLQGDEIGKYIAQAIENGVTARRPWYEPTEDPPDCPVVSSPMLADFDTLLIEPPAPQLALAAAASETAA